MGESASLETTHRSLNTAGLRGINQRFLIMEIICQGEGYLGADEIYRRIRERRSSLSLPTVYCALQK
ncbi:transcriptional repressor [Dehalococcoidia bacterium]|nr:transcriptional repressor [Dehalococcoidia bacterium]